MDTRAEDRLTVGRPPERFADTLRRLRGAQKSGRGPAYLRYVNRRLGRPLAAAAYQLGLSPNNVTAISAVLTYGGIALLAVSRPSPVIGAVVALLLLVGFALDSADGQLARLLGSGSVAGEWLDHVVDVVKVSAFHLAVLISLYRGGELDELWLLVPVGFTVVASLAFFSDQLFELLVRTGGGRRPDRSARSSLILLPTDYGVLCLSLFLLGWADTFIAVYGLLFVLCGGHVAVTLSKRFTELRAIDRLRESA